MFLNFFKLIKLPFHSGASRNLNFFLNKFCIQDKIKQLSLKKKWKAGRNSDGRIIVWTKSNLLKKYKFIKINYNIRYNKLSFVCSFQFIPFKNKLLSLIYFANGSVTYFITTENHFLFSYIYLNKTKKIRKYLENRYYFENNYWSIIFKLKKLIYISFIEILPGKNAQYCLSSGSQSKLLSIDKKNYIAMIQLPSKIKKTISYYSCVFLGRISLVDKKKYNNTKSGYWRSFGLKSIVRGVAMNPVDHPHGGRTKSIRYQRTPWGKTTKKK